MSDDLAVHDSNVEQRDWWDGRTGEYWAANADRYNEGLAGYHGSLLDAAAVEPADTVLDIGCGNGLTTRDAARRASSGSVLGVDLSSPMLALARRLTERERLGNVTYEQGDAQVHPFAAERFDVALSRCGSMFFGDPPAAFGNIARALRPGGRLVLLTWQSPEHNEWQRTFRPIAAAGRDLPVPPPGAPGPNSLSDPDVVHGLLGSAGFDDIRLTDLRAPMYFGPDPDDACRFISGQLAFLLDDLDPDTKAGALAALRADMAAHHTATDGVRYDSATWLIEAHRP
ncbi:class I SAM-dependent methyltransferase [Pseudonocardia spinosispora]|uniref:class I SAM-dependent methyltransferase n=1 Tax=Pseudonocardia spinosispora TaxID=103441 RepID=UPI0004221E00|nr:class I SAM-dependent methyltransferase [Pseudonocardia spinosispora]